VNYIKKENFINGSIEVGITSIIGDRDYQQDYLYFSQNDKSTLATVCDGMGGLDGGEKASYTAANMLGDAFENSKPDIDYVNFFKETAYKMNENVKMLVDSEGKPIHAGSTVVSVIIKSDLLYMMSIGDSHIYILRDNKLVQLNKEHNYYEQLMSQLRAGEVTKEFVEKEKATTRVDALTSFIGVQNLYLIDLLTNPIKLEKGDIIILCSDGLYKNLSDEQIQAITEDNDISMQLTADRLIERSRALKKEGKQDNTSVLVLKYKGY
jgi:hypothetical protein